MRTARDLAVASLSAVKAGDRQGWLDLYEEDAIVEDPVGPSHFDPEGKGHRGKAAIARFWDVFSANQGGFDFELHKTALCADELAAYATLHITLKDGQKFSVDVLNVYKRSPNGKLASLRSFWEIG
jgi:steroid delta-isomerase